jgi:serine/threonine-protein kinase
MDHRGDLYSVGVMMYELLTGRLPFQGPTSMDILLAHATERAPSFAELGLAGWVPREVEQLVFECLAKDPADRPQTARELAERYDTALDRAMAKLEARAAAAAAEPVKSGSAHGIPGLADDTSDYMSGSSSHTPLQQNTSREEAALPFHMEAWMPERVAIMKLRGFVHDAGGEVLESLPGLIKVRLGGRKGTASGAFAWLGLGRRSGVVDVELHLQHNHPGDENRLTVHVLFRPSHPRLMRDEEWRNRCSQIFIELRAYLMGRETVD